MYFRNKNVVSRVFHKPIRIRESLRKADQVSQSYIERDPDRRAKRNFSDTTQFKVPPIFRFFVEKAYKSSSPPNILATGCLGSQPVILQQMVRKAAMRREPACFKLKNRIETTNRAITTNHSAKELSRSSWSPSSYRRWDRFAKANWPLSEARYRKSPAPSLAKYARPS
mgnify:FL=1